MSLENDKSINVGKEKCDYISMQLIYKDICVRMTEETSCLN